MPIKATAVPVLVEETETEKARWEVVVTGENAAVKTYTLPMQAEHMAVCEAFRLFNEEYHDAPVHAD